MLKDLVNNYAALINHCFNQNVKFCHGVETFTLTSIAWPTTTQEESLLLIYLVWNDFGGVKQLWANDVRDICPVISATYGINYIYIITALYHISSLIYKTDNSSLLIIKHWFAVLWDRCINRQTVFLHSVVSLYPSWNQPNIWGRCNNSVLEKVVKFSYWCFISKAFVIPR